MIIPQKMKARLSDRQDYNDRYAQYRFELSEPFKLANEAGQYVMFKVADETMRAYSMADRPDVENSFEILVDHQPNGLGTNFLRNLKFGQEVEILAPLGQLTVKEEVTADTLVFIATGCGISPFKAIITDQLQLKKTPRKIVLLWGMRHDDELFWTEDFQSMQDAYENFTFLPLISRPSEDWAGETGRVTDFLRDTEFDASTHFYTCGAKCMVDEVHDILVNKGIEPNKIETERFHDC